VKGLSSGNFFTVKAERFIASRLKTKGEMAIVLIAISFFVIIIAQSVSSGFRRTIGREISAVSGDIQIAPTFQNYLDNDDPITDSPSYLENILNTKGVEVVQGVIYAAGIAKKGSVIRGVLFKGISSPDSSLHAIVPKELASSLNLSEGDEFYAYFSSKRLKIRKLTVTSVKEDMLGSTQNIIVEMPISDLRRVNGWKEHQVSALEITLDEKYRSSEALKEKAAEIGAIIYSNASDEDEMLVAVSSAESFAHIYDWLELIDLNVIVILALMIIVAGFNMISGLLILLFRNISTIGTLKSLGMRDKGIASIFLRITASIVVKGMLVGNACALILCIVQKITHLIKLDPTNYFVSYIPVEIDFARIVIYDSIAFVVIMLLMLIPCMFISRIDPSETSKTE